MYSMDRGIHIVEHSKISNWKISLLFIWNFPKKLSLECIYSTCLLTMEIQIAGLLCWWSWSFISQSGAGWSVKCWRGGNFNPVWHCIKLTHFNSNCLEFSMIFLRVIPTTPGLIVKCKVFRIFITRVESSSSPRKDMCDPPICVNKVMSISCINFTWNVIIDLLTNQLIPLLWPSRIIFYSFSLFLCQLMSPYVFP